MSAAATAATEFQEQLKEVEAQMDGISRGFDDLCPKDQRECLARLETTMKSLEKIRAGLVEAQKRKAEPDVNVVQVNGLQTREYVTGLDFERSFQAIYTKLPPPGLSLTMENNYKIDAKKRLFQVKECFLRFQSEEYATYVLGLQKCNLNGTQGNFKSYFEVTFAQPTQDFATRETLRRIGTLVDRLKEIERELLSIGAVREGSVYDGALWKPSDKLIDKSFFSRNEGLPTFKRFRASDLRLDVHAHTLLLSKKPVDMPRLLERIRVLSNEECDALIQLREFQLHGWDFDF
jgi:hypothetical protein